jgi:hypothetical protein
MASGRLMIQPPHKAYCLFTGEWGGDHLLTSWRFVSPSRLTLCMRGRLANLCWRCRLSLRADNLVMLKVYGFNVSRPGGPISEALFWCRVTIMSGYEVSSSGNTAQVQC